jgi:hypothetical protein
MDKKGNSANDLAKFFMNMESTRAANVSNRQFLDRSRCFTASRLKLTFSMQGCR